MNEVVSPCLAACLFLDRCSVLALVLRAEHLLAAQIKLVNMSALIPQS
jgi:hypothetical protein